MEPTRGTAHCLGSLTQESLGAEDSAELRIEDFEGDVAIVLAVAGEIDRGHPSAANLSLERVRGSERALQLFANCGHAGEGW